jgi:hypothetical protein
MKIYELLLITLLTYSCRKDIPMSFSVAEETQNLTAYVAVNISPCGNRIYS